MQWQRHEPGLMSDCPPHIHESIEEQLNTVAALEASGALKAEAEAHSFPQVIMVPMINLIIDIIFF